MTDRKPMDPALRRYLDDLAGLAPPPPGSEQERVTVVRAMMPGALERRGTIPGLPNRTETREVQIAAHLSARLYSPPSKTPRPLLVYLHGGGWVAGTVATHDPFCRLLSEASGVGLLSVEYRRAPEHRYPAALEDTLAAYAFASTNAASLSADPERLGLGGDSAGANLAAAAANQLGGTTGAPGLRALMLLFPVADHPSANHASYTENATGCGLEAKGMRWFWDQYAPEVSPSDPGASPLREASLPPLPKTLVTTAEYDVLRDEGIAYEQKLEAAGVDVEHFHAADMHHNYPVHPGTVNRFPQSITALEQIAAWLRNAMA